MTRDMRPPPFPAVDGSALVEAVSDWAELYVIASGRPLTRDHLQTILARESVPDLDDRVADVWLEIERRDDLHGVNWAVKLSGRRLVGPRTSRNSLFQFFLSALSLGYDIDAYGRRLFEECVSDVISSLTCNYGLRLGFPRTPGMPTPFPEAVRMYAGLSRETKIKDPPASDKDLGIDVVSWMQFGDRRGGYLHFVGQCATGIDWYEKLDDLNVDVWRSYIRWPVPPVRFFATPHVVPRERWERSCIRGGLLLDRPRLVQLESSYPLGRRRLAAVLGYCRNLY